MSKIKVLPEHIANKIAAGEVVDRPVNIVKELVENALDAGATEIKIEILDGGVSLIRVYDNGIGIEQEDLPLTIMRFATSKIDTYEDLFKISTYGFRGEALAAISSVSNFNIKSGSYELSVDFGKVGKVTPTPFYNGTIVTVKNLFSKIPARYKFLKSPISEQKEIIKYIKQIILLNPDKSFKLIGNEKVLLEFGGNETLINKGKKIFGVDELEEVNYEEDGLRISGLISLPNVQKFRKDNIFIGVNKRVIKDNMIVQSILQAYYRKIPDNRYPVASINIEVLPDFVDVNIHPAKMFVKFYNSNKVFKAVFNAVNKTLNFSKKNTCEKTEYSNSEMALSNYHNVGEDNIKYTVDLTKLIEIENVKDLQKENFINNENNDLIILGQLFSTVIVVEKGEEVLFIDQHIAHERVLYEKLMKKDNPINSVILTEPFLLECGSDEIVFAIENREKLINCGIDLEIFGEKILKINSLPAEILNKNIEEEIRSILVKNDLDNNNNFIEPIYLNIACKCAIKAGERLLMDEMKKLVSNLFKCENPYTCPHGRPIIFKLNKNELFKKFHR
ncbi:DNA mismatch repair endonuclease MutL [Deferribacter abyssi]|uniref:DNA mismatch repair endonuclease MutL n=1 Tax=Deferribacter abyssi TaxID=213806 RepID=UPI003C1A78F4